MGRDKLTLPLLGRPLIVQTLSPFLSWPRLTGLAVSVTEGREKEFQELAAQHFPDSSVLVVTGGAERQDSIRLALEALANKYSPNAQDQILIHDGARPFVSRELFEAVLDGLQRYSGMIPAVPVRDTIKRVDGHAVLGTEDRESLRLVQTPQAFGFCEILSYHQRAREEDFLGTDDASLVEHYGGTVGWTEGPVHNLKVTLPEDIPMMEELGKRMCRLPK